MSALASAGSGPPQLTVSKPVKPQAAGRQNILKGERMASLSGY